MSQSEHKAGFFRKTTDRAGFTAEMLERYSDIIDKAKRIFVKPNIVSHEPYPTTTHPDVLDETLKFLKGRDILVGDGPAVDIMHSHRIIIEHTLHHVCERHNVKVIDLHQSPTAVYKTPRGFSIALSKTPFNFDFIISLPVLKSHKFCTMTGALKNQFGFCTKAERLKLHAGIKDIHKAVAEINTFRPPSLVIMDAVDILIDTNEVRHGGKPAHLGYMLAGTDPVALDARGFELLVTVDRKLWGKHPKDVKHIYYAAEYGVGRIDGEVEEI